MHAEAVLLVDDDEAQVAEGYAVLEQRMGADHELGFAGCDAGQDLFPRLALFAPGEERHLNTRRLAELCERRVVLAGKDLGGHHKGPLRPALHGGGKRQQRNHRLAGTDVALKQAQHALVRGHVAQDLLHRPGLRGGEAVGQGPDELCPEIASARKPAPLCPLHAGAHQRQGELVRQQLVIGEPSPCCSIGACRRGCFRPVHGVKRCAE